MNLGWNGDERLPSNWGAAISFFSPSPPPAMGVRWSGGVKVPQTIFYEGQGVLFSLKSPSRLNK